MAVKFGDFAAGERVCVRKGCRKGLGGVERQYALQKSGGVRGSCKVPVLGATLRLVESLPRRKSLEGEVVADALQCFRRAAAVARQARCLFPSRKGSKKRAQLELVLCRGVVAREKRVRFSLCLWRWTLSKGDDVD